MPISESKSSADLEREVNEQRSRVEARVNEIRDRLSPGQLLDEALSYTKNGGAHFATNLGHQISANPLPAALVGVGLAWLIAGGTQAQHAPAPMKDWRADDYPYARVPSGGLRRVGHAADQSGDWYSEFRTESGQSFKAKASEFGERAGHFTDETGKRFAGFIDDAGNRIRDFQDESGNRLADALGWASHGWQDVSGNVGQMAQNATRQAGRMGAQLAQGGQSLAEGAQTQAQQLSSQIADLFDQQPLIAGALAFAAGAAIGAVLPRTQQENELFGEQARQARDKVAETASDLYEQGKDKAAELYSAATEAGADIYDKAKDRVSTGINGGGATQTRQ